jgi:hypothetical protein
VITEYELIEVEKRIRLSYDVLALSKHIEPEDAGLDDYYEVPGVGVEVFQHLVADLERPVEECRRALAASRVDRAFPPAF